MAEGILIIIPTTPQIHPQRLKRLRQAMGISKVLPKCNIKMPAMKIMSPNKYLWIDIINIWIARKLF